MVSIITKGNKRKGLEEQGAIESALRRKQIPLCKTHHDKMHQGDVKKEDLDEEYTHAKTKYLRADVSVISPE